VVDGIDCKNCILPDVRMSMFLELDENLLRKAYETRSAWGKKGLKELWFTKLAEESKCHSTYILIGMLKIVSDCIANIMSFKYH